MTDIPNILALYFFFIVILFIIFDFAFAAESLDSPYFSST